MDGRTSGPLGGPLAGPRSADVSGPVRAVRAAHDPSDRFSADPVGRGPARASRTDGVVAALRRSDRHEDRPPASRPGPTGRTPADPRHGSGRARLHAGRGQARPNDPWNRLGSVSVARAGRRALRRRGRADALHHRLRRAGDTSSRTSRRSPRCCTEATTFRVFLSSYSEEPGWRVSLDLDLHDRRASGYRRPILVALALRRSPT